MKIPFSSCCTGTGKAKTALTSYFVNYFTYECISKSNAIRFFTQLSKKQLKKCFQRELNKNIGDDCNQCSNKNPASLRATTELLMLCVNRSIEASHVLGKPSKNVFHPEWLPCPNCSWKVIYSRAGLKGDKKKCYQT